MPRPFGSDQVEALPAGRIRLSCRRPKTWVARKPAAAGRALHPGTAVRWEEDLWEVVAAEETAGGGARYELARWDDQHAIRLLLPYDETSEAERASDARDLARRRSGAWAAWLLSPLVGLLPGRVQERLELELGVRATALTLASIPAPFAVGTFALLMTLASGFGPGLQMAGPAFEPLFPLLSLLLPESLLRLAVGMAQGVPIGSVLGLPLYVLGRATGLVDRPVAVAPTEAPDAGRRLEDRFLLLEPLLSFLPAADQTRLAEGRGFAPATWGRRTAWFLLVYPGLTAPAHAWRLVSQDGGLGSVLLLVIALGLGAEQVVRLRTLSKGEPAPSVLGRLVAPLAAPLLR